MDEFSDPVLTQIGICLDKKFQVIGCELTHGGIYGKCPKSGAVEYPATEKLNYQTGRRGIHPAPLEAGHAGWFFFNFLKGTIFILIFYAWSFCRSNFLRLIIIFLDKGQNPTIFLVISKFLQILGLQPRIGKSFSQLVVEQLFNTKCWYFVTKIVLIYCEKKCSSDREKLLKFEAESQEFANIFNH